MSTSPRAQATATAMLIAALSITMLGCGRKAPPLPPQIRVADQTRDLSVVQETGTVVLEWSYPSSTTAGGPLPDLEMVEVWRAAVPVAGEPQGTTFRDRQIKVQLLQANGELIAELDSEGLRAHTRGPKLRLEDELEALPGEAEEAETLLWYAVRSRCCGDRKSAFSNIARLQPETPPPAPQWLNVAGTKEGIELGWSQEEGMTTLVERSADQELWLSLTTEAMKETELLDSSALQGNRWHYRLRSVRKSKGNARVVGEPGEVKSVDHPDLYPPAAPLNLVCLPEDEKVRLRWQSASQELRYRISRALANRRPEIVAENVTGTEHEDLSPPYGRLVYSVQAMDAAGNLSEAATCETVIGAAP